MKKIILITVILLGFLNFNKAQSICTQTNYIPCVKYQNTDLLQIFDILAVTNGTASVSTSTLFAIKKGIDTLNQSERYNVGVLKMTKTTGQLWGSAILGVSSGTINGVRTISFKPNAAMTGSINGIAVDGTYYKPFDNISVSATPPAGVLNGITYTILTGSVLINYVQ